jgi:hypothetical protein
MTMSRISWTAVSTIIVLCQASVKAADLDRLPSLVNRSSIIRELSRTLSSRGVAVSPFGPSHRSPVSIQRPRMSSKRAPLPRGVRELSKTSLLKQAFGPESKDVVLVSDGDGGALYFWAARIGADYAILAQRLDASGASLWNDGFPQVVSIGEIVERRNPVAVSDGAGGAFLFFTGEYISGDLAGHIDVFGQHVDGNGTRLWNEGFPLEVMATDQIERNPVAVPDGIGGVIVAAELEFVTGEFAGHIDIFGQRIDRDGNMLWNDGSPKTLIATDELERHPAATGDGNGGIILATELEFTEGEFEGHIDIFVQRLDKDGNSLWNDGDPLTLIGTDFPEKRPIVVTDGDGGAIVVSEFEFTSDVDVVAQRVDSNGNLLWNDGDLVGVATTEQNERNPSVVPDGSGGIKVVVELEFISGEAAGHIDIFGQWVDGQGDLQWNEGDPLEIMITDEAERFPVAVSDGGGGIIVAAQLEFVTSEFLGHVDIFGQRVSASGSLTWNLEDPLSLMATDEPEGAPLVVTDEDGGLILGARVGHSFGYLGEDAELHGQRIDGIGNILWIGESGEAVIISQAGEGTSSPVGEFDLNSVQLDGQELQENGANRPVDAGPHTLVFEFDNQVILDFDFGVGMPSFENFILVTLPDLTFDGVSNVVISDDETRLSMTVEFAAETTYQFFAVTDPGTDNEHAYEFFAGTTTTPVAKISGSVTLSDKLEGAVPIEMGPPDIVLFEGNPLEAFGFSSNGAWNRDRKAALSKIMKAAKRAFTQGEPLQEDPFPEAIRGAYINGDLSYTFSHVPDGTFYVFAETYLDLDGFEVEALGLYDADGDGDPDPVTVSSQRNVQGIDMVLEAFDEGNDGSDGAKILVESFILAGETILEDVPSEFLPSGPQAVQIMFDSPLQFFFDFDGNLIFENLNVQFGPYLAIGTDITNLSTTADGLVLNATINLKENTSYQMMIGPDEIDSFDEIQQFYFGTSAFPAATVSGVITPPEEFRESNVEFSTVFLLDRDIVDAFDVDEAGLKPALRSALKGVVSKPTALQNDDEDVTTLALVRATDIKDDWSYELNYVPDGEYYVQLAISLEDDVILLGAYGTDTFEEDPLPVIVGNGESVERLDIEAIELDFGFRDLVGLTVVEVDFETGTLQLDSPDGERIQAEVGILTSVVDLDGEMVDLASITVGSTVNIFGILFEGAIGAFTVEVVEIAQPVEGEDDGGVEFTVFPQDGSGEWSLDLDGETGDQGLRELNGVKPGDEFAVELVNNQNVSPALGGSFTIVFNPEKMEPITSSITGIAAQLGAPVVEGSEVRFTLAGMAGVPVDQGHVGEIKFRALVGFEGETEIKLINAAIGDATTFANVESEPNASIVIRSIGTSSGPNPDFDGDGEVGFRDFILFAQRFGARTGEQLFDAQYDLDSNGDIGFRDFILFAQVYGKSASEFVAP